jgi:putative hydrolase of the HAD superfamily
MTVDNPNVLLFDFGGVIINLDLERTKNAFAHHGIKNVESWFKASAQNETLNLFETGKISANQFIDRVLTTANVSMTEALFITNWNALLLDIPLERITLLQKLKSYYKLYMLSNINSIHAKKCNQILNETSGIEDIKTLFDKVYFSYEIGFRKPDSHCFQYVLDDLSIDPENVLFFDDNTENIATAKAMGIQSFLVQNDIENLVKEVTGLQL